MRFSAISAAVLASGASAARPFLEEPDTGIELAIPDLKPGTLPELSRMVGLNDFQWTAQKYLPVVNYTYYRNGAGGEWSYRNNLEVFNRYRLRPRTLYQDITKIESTFPTTIMGYNFTAPFFISPCARADYANPGAEMNLVEAAGEAGILYIESGFSSLPMEQIAKGKVPGQTVFNQLYTNDNETATQILFDRVKASGGKAIVWTIDAPGSPSRQRAARFDVGSANNKFITTTWDVYHRYTNMTDLPIVLKGVQTVEDAEAAIANGVKTIILSNHGGRNLDGSPSSLEVAIEIFKKDPTIFDKIEILADGGIRYGTDALRLLALGVKAVGLGRPIMFSNIFGKAGVSHAIELFRNELMNDAANMGVGNIHEVNSSMVDLSPNFWYS
ncbi:hypothetical protein TD95_004596 [Thielaviopsis punctulata]|uniref:FMN hydroxy acid dehydrogenase domain-containing protein n=1 Tax=Thielaviopsis punctulata TaxID=72032 RepID=A0A0F4ZLR0_9PEZI|nr:hypothetical protein TD95_004596 [Thielaviopsis punctulata]